MARGSNSHHVLPLFCDDLIASTVDMTPGCFGAYMRILCYAWTRGGVPNDEQACSRIAGGFGKGDWKAIRQRLMVIDAGTDEERLSHQRLELERAAVAELKEAKSKAGQEGARRRWQGQQPPQTAWQNDGRAMAVPLAEPCDRIGKTIAPTPTPTPTHHQETFPPHHASVESEPWAGHALDRWVPFREEWNRTPGADPWMPLTPPTGSAWLECVSNSSWLEQYPIALSKLAGLRMFKNPVTLTQFLSDGWVGRIVAGDFDREKSQHRHGKQRPARSNF